MSKLLDTVILIDVMRSNQKALATIAAISDQPSVCDVSTMELYGGARSQKEEYDIERLLARFRRVTIGPEIYRQAGNFQRHYRDSHGTGVADALIAATAEHHGLALVTLNVKHFPMFKKLRAPY
jgi:predicted nucleic acid-binding protein